MPPKVLPNQEDFSKFEQLLLGLHFRPITRREFKRDFIRLGLMAPSPRTGRESGYSFSANGLTVKVWTTWMDSDERVRDNDAGWVLITDGDKAVYFSHPLHRTKNFLLTLLRKAWIARWRVLNRPLCPECLQFMDIVPGPSLKSRYWRCDRRDVHIDRKIQRKDWDEGLPPNALEYIEAERKERRRYKGRLHKAGIEPKPAILKRTGWKQTRPAQKNS